MILATGVAVAAVEHLPRLASIRQIEHHGRCRVPELSHPVLRLKGTRLGGMALR